VLNGKSNYAIFSKHPHAVSAACKGTF